MNQRDIDMTGAEAAAIRRVIGEVDQTVADLMDLNRRQGDMSPEVEWFCQQLYELRGKFDNALGEQASG